MKNLKGLQLHGKIIMAKMDSPDKRLNPNLCCQVHLFMAQGGSKATHYVSPSPKLSLEDLIKTITQIPFNSSNVKDTTKLPPANRLTTGCLTKFIPILLQAITMI